MRIEIPDWGGRVTLESSHERIHVSRRPMHQLPLAAGPLGESHESKERDGFPHDELLTWGLQLFLVYHKIALFKVGAK